VKSFVFYLVSLLALASMDLKGQNPRKQSMTRLLALGDSYTIGESVAEVQRWPVQLVDALAKEGYRFHPPDIIAVTGWRTDDLKKALMRRQPSSDYDLVSLLIGVNNQYQGRDIKEYEKEFEELLDMAIDYAGGDKSKVFILSIPDYGYTPFGQGRQHQITSQINDFNSVNRKITVEKGVAYFDITDISRQGLNNPGLVAEDGLHPSGKMYSLWVERMLKDPSAPWR
jgi:lysophospholipase L1-like esterase